MENNPFLQRDQEIRAQDQPKGGKKAKTKAKACRAAKCVKKTTDPSGFCSLHREAAGADTKLPNSKSKSKAKGKAKGKAQASPSAAEPSGPQLWTTALKKAPDSESPAAAASGTSKTVNFKGDVGSSSSNKQQERTKAKTAAMMQAKKAGRSSRMTITASRQIALQGSTWTRSLSLSLSLTVSACPYPSLSPSLSLSLCKCGS